jgi:hypothetical protein
MTTSTLSRMLRLEVTGQVSRKAFDWRCVDLLWGRKP